MIKALAFLALAHAHPHAPLHEAQFMPGFRPGFQFLLQGAAGSSSGSSGSSSPQTPGCTTTGGYQGLGDCLASNTSLLYYVGIRAASYAAAQLHVYMFRVRGSYQGTPESVDVRAKSDGTPDLSGVTPGLANGPCATDGSCYIDFYRQQTQVNAGVASNNGGQPQMTGGSTGNNFTFWQNCSHNNVKTTTLTTACWTSDGSVSEQDQTSNFTVAQPFTVEDIVSRVNQNNEGYFGGGSTYGTNPEIQGYGSANTFTAQAGNGVNGFTAYDSALATAYGVVFNGASSISAGNGNVTTASGFNPGSNGMVSPVLLRQHQNGGQATTIGFETAVIQGAQDGAHLTATEKNQSTYYGLGF